MEKAFEYKQKIQELLEERPEYIPYQKKIEAALKKAGNKNNRITILHTMMLDKLRELHEALSKLT